MKSLYQWLLDKKGYSSLDAEETILRYDLGIYLPDNVRNDISQYSLELIQSL